MVEPGFWLRYDGVRAQAFRFVNHGQSVPPSGHRTPSLISCLRSIFTLSTTWKIATASLTPPSARPNLLQLASEHLTLFDTVCLLAFFLVLYLPLEPKLPRTGLWCSLLCPCPRAPSSTWGMLQRNRRPPPVRLALKPVTPNLDVTPDLHVVSTLPRTITLVSQSGIFWSSTNNAVSPSEGKGNLYDPNPAVSFPPKQDVLI